MPATLPTFSRPLSHGVLTSLGDDELAAFRLFVPLFGVAEGRVYRADRKEWGNHWWHRNRVGQRVIRDPLTDPECYRMSKRDDQVKGRLALTYRTPAPSRARSGTST